MRIRHLKRCIKRKVKSKKVIKTIYIDKKNVEYLEKEFSEISLSNAINRLITFFRTSLVAQTLFKYGVDETFIERLKRFKRYYSLASYIDYLNYIKDKKYFR